jgi:hypothetical protein
MRTVNCALLGAVLLFSGIARAETINFDDLPNLTTVTNQYANVIFSAGGGDVVLTTAQNPPYLGSQPNLICTGSTAGAIDCTQDFTLTFTTPVDDIYFTAYGNQTPAPGQFAEVDVYQNGVLTQPDISLDVSHTVHCPTYGDCAGDPQSLLYTDITEIAFHDNTDPAGTAYDDFSFTPETDSGAPEPSTFFLATLGGAGVVGLRRRRGRISARFH